MCTRMLDMTSNLDKIIIISKMTGCAVLGCRSNNNKKLRRNNGAAAANNTKINFHRFPKNKRLCDTWLKQCGRNYKYNITHAKICSEHFRADCYERNLQHELLSITPKCKKLKPEAIPTERLPDMGRLKPKPSNYLGKRICHRRNATETNTYEDENSQPEQNQISTRPMTVKEERRCYNHPILPKPIAKPIKLVFVNAATQPQSVTARIPNRNGETIPQQLIATSHISNDYTPTILRSTLMLPPGTTIKHIPNNSPNSSKQETNKPPPNVDKAHDEQTPTILPPRTIYRRIADYKVTNLAINKERLKIEKDRQKFHEIIADKLFAMLVNRSGNNNSDRNDNFINCNIKQEI